SGSRRLARNYARCDGKDVGRFGGCPENLGVDEKVSQASDDVRSSSLNSQRENPIANAVAPSKMPRISETTRNRSMRPVGQSCLYSRLIFNIFPGYPQR